MLTILIIVIGGIYGSTMPQEPSAKSWGDAPDFTLTTINDETFTLSDHFGKVIVIDLMDAWCHWCKPQMDELDAVLEEKGDEIVIVSVDVDKSETNNDVMNTFGGHVEKWTFVLDNYKEEVSSKYKVTGIPKLVIIDKKGNIYYLESGLTAKKKS